MVWEVWFIYFWLALLSVVILIGGYVIAVVLEELKNIQEDLLKEKREKDLDKRSRKKEAGMIIELSRKM